MLLEVRAVFFQSTGVTSCWVPSDRTGGGFCLWALPVAVSGGWVNSAAEEQRVKLRFAGASCQSEETRSTVAMVTSGGGKRAPAGCCRWISGGEKIYNSKWQFKQTTLQTFSICSNRCSSCVVAQQSLWVSSRRGSVKRHKMTTQTKMTKKRHVRPINQLINHHNWLEKEKQSKRDSWVQ